MAIVSLGLVFRIRVFGYLMAALFALLIVIILSAGVLGRGLGAAEWVRCLVFAGLGYWCFSWAWNLGIEQAANKPKLAAPRQPKPSVVADVTDEAAPETLVPSRESTEPTSGSQWTWVWLVALGSFIPFGFAVWYFVGREAKPPAKPPPTTQGKAAPAAPAAEPTVKPSAPVVTTKASPPAKAAVKTVEPVAKPTPAPPTPQPTASVPKAASPPVAEATGSSLPWTVPDARPASVDVRDMKLVPLAVGTNRLDWAVVPTFFRERPAQIMALTLTAGVETGLAEYTVRTSGYAIIACGFGYQGNNSGGWTDSRWTAAEFEAKGWQPIPSSAVGGTLTMVDVNRVMTLFWKPVTAGETGRIRCNKYYPPFFIALGER